MSPEWTKRGQCPRLNQTLNIMQVINTKTGEDVTRDYIALLEGKMTKQEFEKKYNLKSC